MTTQQSAAASGIQTPIAPMTAAQRYPPGDFQPSARFGIPAPDRFLEVMKEAVGEQNWAVLTGENQVLLRAFYGVMANEVIHCVRRSIAEVRNNINGRIDEALNYTEIVANRAQEEVLQVNLRAAALEALTDRTPVAQSTQAAPMRRPKIGEPPEFSGADSRVKLSEWLDRLTIWMANEGAHTDEQKIVTALAKLTGPAYQYMGSYYSKLRDGRAVGTWRNFMKDLQSAYGQRDEKEGAKAELTKLFANKDLASKDFVKYAERFNTLARISEWDDDLLIEKLKGVLTQELRIMTLARENMPDEWPDYLQQLLVFYKNLHPEKAQGKIFGSTHESSKDTSVPMDIDTAKAKKKQQANSAESKDSKDKKFCHVCKKRSHNTDDCWKLKKNDDKRPPKGKTSTPFASSSSPPKFVQGSSKDGQKKTKRVARQVTIYEDITDDEDSTPTASAAANTMRAEPTAFIEEVREEDEPRPRNRWDSEIEEAAKAPVDCAELMYRLHKAQALDKINMSDLPHGDPLRRKAAEASDFLRRAL